MNTFWLRMVFLVIVVIALAVFVNVVLNRESEPKPAPKTFQDVIEEDDRRLRAEPEPKQPVQTELTDQTNQIDQEQAQSFEQKVAAQKKELTIEEQVRAEQLFELAIAQRKIARLPGMSYKLMVDYCRDIISNYPSSSQAPKARRMLGEVPKRQWDRYNITEEEINAEN